MDVLTRYEFEGFSLDVQALELRDQEGSVRELSPSGFELLAYLIRNRERVVLKEELYQALWPDVSVNENALAQCVWAARRAIGDEGRAQRLIKNVRGRGYRFVGEVVETSAVPPQTPSAPPSARPTEADPLVAREVELEWLVHTLEQSAAGEGRICLLAGEAGIGKTRVVQELQARAQGLGYMVLEGRCHDDEGMPPFWPWKQVLRAFEKASDVATLRECVGSDGPDLAKVIPDLRHRIADIGAAPDRDVDDDRYCLFEAVSGFLARCSARRPMLVALDDLHWADPASLRLLKFIAPAIGRMRCVVVGTYRREDLSEGARKILGGVARQSFATERELRGLTADGVQRLLDLAGRRVTAGIAERVLAVTGGNPLFVRQVAKLLDPADGRGGSIEEELPSELRDALGRRVASLPAVAQKVLCVAAILGGEFRLSDVRRASGLESNDLLAVLDGLTGHWITRDDGDQLGAYRFAHPLIRETVYRSIPPPERVLLHGQAAQAIEQAYAHFPSARLDEVAHHYYAAAPSGFAAKAVHYGRLAAERAFGATAFEEAARHYRRALQALELVDPPDESARAELTLALAQSMRGAGEPVKEVRALFSSVASRAAELGDVRAFADAALGYAGNGPLRLGKLTEMGIVDTTEVDLLTRAASLLGEVDSEKKALVLSWLARALYHSSNVELRTRTAEEAVAMARRLGDPVLLARVLLQKQQISRTPHTLDQRIADLGETLRITQSVGARELSLDALYERAWALTEASRFAEAEDDIRLAGRLADELRQPHERRPLEMWDLVHAYVRENVDEVEARDMQRLATRRHAHSTQSFGLRLLMARYLQGRAAETLPLLENYAEEFPLPVSWRCGLASTYATVGRIDEARREFEALAANDFADVPPTHDWLSSYGLLANTCSILGDDVRARTLRDILLPFAGNTLVMGFSNWISGPVAAVLGDLERLLGDADAARAHYEHAEELARRLRSPVLVAWIQVRRAELIVEDRPRDALQARALVVQAQPALERAGALFLRDRIERLRRRLSLAS